MKFTEAVLLFVAVSGLGVYEAASLGWLGPYGLPGDNLHLLLVVAVLTFTFMVYIFVSARTRGDVT